MPDVFYCLNKDDDDDDDNDDDHEGVFIWGDLSQDYWCKITWVMLHQRTRWIYNQNGFIGSFDAPWHDLSDPGSLMLIQFTPKECTPKAGLHRQFLSQELDAIFVSLKLQLQNCMCKMWISVWLVAVISQGFEHVWNLMRQKLQWVATTKITGVNKQAPPLPPPTLPSRPTSLS